VDLKYILEVDDQGTPTLKDFDSSVDKSERNTGKASQKMSKNFEKVSKFAKRTALAVGAIGVALVGVAFLKFGKDAVRLAADFAETEQKFGVVFQSIRKESNETAAELARDFGLSNKAAKELLSGTGDLLTGLGFTDKAALDLSKNVNTLAVDLASFTNIEGGAARASDAITKALLGEREMLKSLGVSISEADVKTRLQAQGLEKLTGVSLKAARAQITYDLILQQTGKAQGDFARSSSSLANQQRILAARFEDLQVNIGKKLTPVVNIFVGVLLKVVDKTSKWIAENDKLIGSGIIQFAKFLANSLAFVAKIAISLVKIFNAFLGGINLIKAGFAALGQVATLALKGILIGLSKVGEFITVGILAGLKKVRQGFLIVAIGVAEAGRVAATSQVQFNVMNAKILDLKRELAEVNKIKPSGINAFSKSMNEAGTKMDENLALLKKFRTEQENAALSAADDAKALDKLSQSVSNLNKEIQANLDKELVRATVSDSVAAKSPGIKTQDPAVLAQQQAAAQAAAAEQVRVAKERDALILASAKELTQFLSIENELRFAAIGEQSAKEIAAATFLREEEKLGFQEFENIKTEILKNAIAEREKIKIEDAQRQSDRELMAQEQKIENLTSREQSLFDIEAGGLFARNDAWLRSQQERMSANLKLIKAEKGIAKQNAKAAQLGAAALGGALLNIAQQQGKKKFEAAKKIAIAEATINTISAAVTAFNTGGGWPGGVVLMLATLASGFAQVSNIKSTSVGGGGGGGATGGGGGGSTPTVSGGGGGGFGSAPDLSPFTEPPLPQAGTQQRQVVINVQGFVGNEAQLASAMAEVIQDAVTDNVDFGLEVGQV